MTLPAAGAGPPPGSPTPAVPRTLRAGDLLVAAGGLLVFGFSFAPFVEYGEQAALLFGLLDISLSFNAWSPQTFMVPLTTFVVLAGLLAITAAAVRFGLRRDPELLGFRLRQLEVGLALFAFLVLLGMVASEKHAVLGARRLASADRSFQAEDVAASTGWGAALMLIGATILVAGTLLNHFRVGPAFQLAGRAAASGQDPLPGDPPPPWQPQPAAPGDHPGPPPPSYWQRPAGPPPPGPPPTGPPPTGPG